VGEYCSWGCSMPASFKSSGFLRNLRYCFTLYRNCLAFLQTSSISSFSILISSSSICFNFLGNLLSLFLGYLDTGRSTSRIGLTFCLGLSCPVLSQDFKIQNIVASCDVKFPIRLEGLAYAHGHFSSVSSTSNFVAMTCFVAHKRPCHPEGDAYVLVKE
jgi:hypothetical protein